MTITKYEHACLAIEEQGSKLIIDPGNFSASFTEAENVVAIVITHSHPDHLDQEKIDRLLAQNPEAKIFTVQDAAGNVSNSTIVGPGQTEQVGPFTLEFFGGNHAVVHPSIPQIKNVGVLVNNSLYYPGDSFATPNKAIKALAAPAAAPWMKISEAMDFLTTVKPTFAFPTHDAILSEGGQGIADYLLGHAAEQAGVEYRRIKTGESFTI